MRTKEEISEAARAFCERARREAHAAPIPEAFGERVALVLNLMAECHRASHACDAAKAEGRLWSEREPLEHALSVLWRRLWLVRRAMTWEQRRAMDSVETIVDLAAERSRAPAEPTGSPG